MPKLLETVLVARLLEFVRTSPRTAAVLAVGALIGFVLFVHLLLAALGQQSSFWQLRLLAQGVLTPSSDSWGVMIIARDWLQANPGADGDLYREIFFEQKNKFQYAPTSLLPLDLFALVGIEPTLSFLNAVNRVIYLLTAAGVGVLCWFLPTRLAAGPLDTDGRRARLLLTVLGPVATMLFFPLLYAYDIGQLQVWISALFLMSCIAWITDRRALAGVLMGLVCLLKPHFGLFLIWGLLRREWSFAIALGMTGALGLAVSVALYGFGNHLAYLEVLSYLSRHGESFWANQSANGLLHRVFGASETREFTVQSFAAFHPGVYIGTLLVTLTLLLSVFTLRRDKGRFVPAYDFMFAAIAFTAASPIAWEHHYGVLMPMFAVLAATWVFASPRPDYTLRLVPVAAAYVIASVPLWSLAFVTGPLHVLQSHLYFSALVVMAVLWRLSQGQWKPRPIRMPA